MLTVVYLFGELQCLCGVQLAVDGSNVGLQLADLLAQLTQRQAGVQALVVQVLVDLQASCGVLHRSLDLRELLAGQLHLE